MLRHNKKFFITTAIDYVNAPPHLGHALEKIQADVLARYHRFLGEEVFFLTGTDENSLKNVQAAEKEGVNVKELVDRNAKKFYELKKILNLSFDGFIRTTEIRHIQGAQKLWLACQKDIYKKKYRGLYCVGCEEFYKENELEKGLCPEHQTKPELVEEENYFFKLSNYQKQLKELIERDKIEIVPEKRKNEILSFINQGLEDICISRSVKRAKGWGVPVPDDETQIIWVWFDALSNYINALGYVENGKKFKEWWQKNENVLHIIGKGILRFHAIYWPAILISAGLKLPNKIFVHGHITVGGQKMSKSLGNIVVPFELVEKYGVDSVRYFLLREILPFEDGDFTTEKFEERYNDDLVKGLGNLVARVIRLTETFDVEKTADEDELEQKTTHGTTLKTTLVTAKGNCNNALNKFKFNEALFVIWQLISFCDKYIEQERPWEGGKKKIVSDLLFLIEEIAKLLKTFLPETSEKILKQIKIKKSEILFPKK